MAKTVYYRQCRYEQKHPDKKRGKRWDVAWIPEKFAKIGRTIYFGEKRKDVPKEELYVVILVGDNRRSAEWLHGKQNADKKQRKASDI